MGRTISGGFLPRAIGVWKYGYLADLCGLVDPLRSEFAPSPEQERALVPCRTGYGTRVGTTSGSPPPSSTATSRRERASGVGWVRQGNAQTLGGINVGDGSAVFIETKGDSLLYFRPVGGVNASLIKPIGQSFNAAISLDLHQGKRPQACDIRVIEEPATDHATEAPVPQDGASATPVTDIAFDHKPGK